MWSFWGFFGFLLVGSTSHGGLDKCSVCWWRCKSSLLTHMWILILKLGPSGACRDPPAGLTLKWEIGWVSLSISPRWPSTGTGSFPSVGLLSSHLSERGWALVVLKFHSRIMARDHQGLEFQVTSRKLCINEFLELGSSGFSRGWKARTDPEYCSLSQNGFFSAEETVQGCPIFYTLFFPSLLWKIKNKTVQMVIMNTCVSAQNKYEHMWIFFIFASDLSFKNLFSDWSLQCASTASSYPSLPPWRYRCRQLVCVYVLFYVISSDKTSIYCLYLLSTQPCFCFWDLSAFCGVRVR